MYLVGGAGYSRVLTKACTHLTCLIQLQASERVMKPLECCSAPPTAHHHSLTTSSITTTPAHQTKGRVPKPFCISSRLLFFYVLCL
ncbi:hypothetical protein E2C01_093985 [Portunus trituberculatus]|uniref:Uncharacterized protein n=1 Tax=Portunus trituberculatus TaxID=210409 RepID=A0A5B7JKJ1_PORTR|nr:hypothetical protein [Portunus trituberculatus]